jgi:hypothetical protein
MGIEEIIRKLGSDLPNYNKETQIFYGVESQNNLMPEVMDEIAFGPDSIDLAYEEGLDGLKSSIDETKNLKELYEVISELIPISKYCSDSIKKENLEQIREILNHYKNHRIGDIKEIVEEIYRENYSCDEIDFLFDNGEYKITKCLNKDIMIIKSPYYTFAPQCSPCVPCAGDLSSIDSERNYSKKTYCLDSSFYDEGNKPKYKIYKVEDNSILVEE